MARLMSVALTAEQVIRRQKTVTRRLGWWTDRHGRRIIVPGEYITLCRRVMGRRRTDGTVEPLDRLADVVVTSVRREPLSHIDAEDVAREGFPHWDPDRFIRFFREHMRCKPDTEVTRIEWRYVGDEGQ